MCIVLAHEEQALPFVVPHAYNINNSVVAIAYVIHFGYPNQRG